MDDFLILARSGSLLLVSKKLFALAAPVHQEMIALDKNEEAIRADWEGVLKRRNCIEIYEYLYNVILNQQDYVGDYALERKFIVRLLKMARDSDLPQDPGPYGNLKQNIEHYIEVFSSDPAHHPIKKSGM